MILMLSAASGPTRCSIAGVEVLGVLAHDDEVDVLVASLDALHRAGRPNVGVELERLAQPTLTDRKPDPTGVVIGPLIATPFARSTR